MHTFATTLIINFALLFWVPAAWSADDAATPSTDTAATEPASAPAGEDSNTEPPKDTQDSPSQLIYITPDKAKQRLDDVLRYLKTYQREDEIIEISGNDGKMAGLYLPENTGKPQGGVLILHDIAQHAQWPNTVSPIREYLPDYGWNTLSIFYDQYIEKPLPKIEPFSFKDALPVDDIGQIITETPENTDNDANQATNMANNETDTSEQPESPPVTQESEAPEITGNADPLDDIANNLDTIPEFSPPISEEVLKQPAIPIEDTFIDDMVMRTEQGLSKLNELGQFNIVIIANGYSANWAAKMLEKRIKNNSKGYALVLIDAKSSLYPQVALNESLAKLNIPMLDIITQDEPEHLRQSKARKGAMLRNQNDKYMQLFIPAIKPSLPSKNNMIARRIRGWLLTHAAGEEVAVKTKTY